jgi:O-antigen/teichoic acid export membrane protein
LNAAESKLTFFRQSGWLVLATGASGAFMMGTQMVAYRWMDPAEYGAWVTLLRIYLLMSIPSTGMQITFAQQTAAAFTPRQQAQLATTVRATFQVTFGIWLIFVAVAWLGARHWMEVLHLSRPAALWVTVLIGLASLWVPIARGVLQGQQNFAGLGWVIMVDGLGRLGAVWVILLLGGQAAGGMTGALLGTGAALLLGVVMIRGVLRRPKVAMDWGPWLRRTVPLTLGIGSIVFMGNADVVYVQAVFDPKITPFGYMPAALIGLALATFVMPLTSVMFPKVVRSAALTQSTRAIEMALGATALLGGGIALGCTLFPELPLRIIFFGKPQFWLAAPLVPWFAWALLPLVLANVLLGGLLARERFAAVGWMVAIAVGYGLSLALLKPRLVAMDEMLAFRVVLQTLGAFSLLQFIVAAWFTLRGPNLPAPVPTQIEVDGKEARQEGGNA